MGLTIAVRTATARDLSAVDRLLAKSYPRLLAADYPPSIMVTAVPMIARAQPRLLACGTYFVAEDADGRILGAGGWTRAREGAGQGDVRHVATHPDAVRHGVGRALVAHVLSDAARAGIVRLTCLSTRTAVPFYRAQGFVEMGPAPVPLAPGIVFPAIRMVRGVEPGRV